MITAFSSLVGGADMGVVTDDAISQLEQICMVLVSLLVLLPSMGPKWPHSQALVGGGGGGKKAWYTLFVHAPNSPGNLHTTLPN